ISFGSGWAGVHGLRTDLAHRGRGLAAHVLAALAAAALQRRIQKVFLQVEQGNSAASALYRRAGFASAWHYRYWSAAQR
ncbi:MAG: GNAT family N-acetyltransferase, partial [Burkholderiaceae bacterium]